MKIRRVSLPPLYIGCCWSELGTATQRICYRSGAQSGSWHRYSGWHRYSRVRANVLDARRVSPARGCWGLSDFTDAAALGVSTAGVPLDHRLYHFRLASLYRPPSRRER